MAIVSELLLNQEQFSDYRTDNTSNVLSLSKINILIGKNNSGKSRFVRKISSEKNINFKPAYINLELISELVSNMKQKANYIYGSHRIGNYEHYFKTLSSINLPTLIDRKINVQFEIAKFRQVMEGLKNEGSQYTQSYFRDLKPFFDSIEKLAGDKSNILYESKFFYIPTLRGLRPVQVNGSENSGDTAIDNYEVRCKRDYFLQASEEKLPLSIFTGLSLYNDTKKLLLGTTEDREKIRKFEDFLSENFFNGEILNIVPRINDDVVHIRIGKDEYPVHQLGDGIQAIIILTYPLFFNQGDYGVFCYEEPEIHMHPGLQRIFIETLLKPEFYKFQYFLTTHSNHFLDLTFDYKNISVFTFQKDSANSNLINVENTITASKKALELIGARPSSVLLSNCTIWVEGITDRLYIRKFLEVYQKGQKRKFKEDFHYSFVEYGGNNITHWSFLDPSDPNHPNINVDSLCANLFLITDRDSAGVRKDGKAISSLTKKQKRHQELSEKLGKQYYCLKCREVENLLKSKIIQLVIKDFEPNITDTNLEVIGKKDYRNVGLGNFITNNVGGLTRKYAADSGTILGKIDFCKTAISNISTVEDLSDEAFNLCKMLHKFIDQHN